MKYLPSRNSRVHDTIFTVMYNSNSEPGVYLKTAKCPMYLLQTFAYLPKSFIPKRSLYFEWDFEYRSPGMLRTRTIIRIAWLDLFLPLGVASCCASIQLVPCDSVNRNKVSIRQLPLFYFPSLTTCFGPFRWDVQLDVFKDYFYYNGFVARTQLDV
jgi:hypothetical protein